jgi:hypothetical protein
MKYRQTVSEYTQKLATYLNNIKKKDPYINSKNQWFRLLSSRTKGTVGELLVGQYLETEGLDVISPKEAKKQSIVDKSIPTSDYDIFILDSNLKCEVKTSTMWSGSQEFRFQQIRKQEYDIIIFQFIYPETIERYYCTKEVVESMITIPSKVQHGGKKKKNLDPDTFWERVKFNTVPEYFIPLNQLVGNKK